LLRDDKAHDRHLSTDIDTISVAEFRWYLYQEAKGWLMYYQEATISLNNNSAGKIRSHHVAVKRDITRAKRLEERPANQWRMLLNFGMID